VRLNATRIHEIARATGFDPGNLEKLIRLKQLLRELHRHPFLNTRLVLKGGTAINLFYLDLARLSVDIDLNYVGQIERGPMFEEKPRIGQAVDRVCRGLGYKVQGGTDEYALLEFYLGFLNYAGNFDQIQVEINFLMRTCALPPELRSAVPLGDDQACTFHVLAIEELFAGKTKAMIDRRHPRDLYDLFRFVRMRLDHDSELLRKLAVLFCSTLDRDFHDYELQRYAAIDQSDVQRLLYPLLRSNDRPTSAQMFAVVKPLLETVLDHRREEKFLKAMATGSYQPELLFANNREIVQRINRHPALLWKAENVAKYLSTRGNTD
jgi:predicted nucleotidyltransferase component of viral defense system